MSMIDTGKEVLEVEADAILGSIKKLDHNFENAVNMMFGTKGRIVITGMGKSGLIGKKISATLTSTGSPSVYLHPSDALHGDIGIINSDDVVIALSTSGETHEVVRLIDYIKRLGVGLISMVGNMNSSLAKESDVVIDCSIEKEACPIGLVPTASTTLSLAMGDALAVSLMRKKGFSADDFRFNHPGGNIGKKLLKVEHCMHPPGDIPVVKGTDPMLEVIRLVDEKKFGAAIITDENLKVEGIITDGDLRRAFLKGNNFAESSVSDFMTADPITITPDSLAVEALNIMEDKKITSLIVAEEKVLKGFVHLHDLWRTEMI